ncbi:MAG: hypothetical protein V2I24_06940, partial [Halieaceae bacterium]|nr:hypothetical protein [Halieaceae bacterium]
LAAVEASASLTLRTLLHPARMARLVAYGSMGDYPDLEEVVDAVLNATWGVTAPEDDYRRQVLEVVQRVTSDEMMILASDQAVSGAARAVLAERLDGLRATLEEQGDARAHARSVAADIHRWQQHGAPALPGSPLQMPPGDPI